MRRTSPNPVVVKTLPFGGGKGGGRRASRSRANPAVRPRRDTVRFQSTEAIRLWPDSHLREGLRAACFRLPPSRHSLASSGNHARNAKIKRRRKSNSTNAHETSASGEQ